MIVWLDHLIFGNGFGLKSPQRDAVFFWIGGEFYHFSHGHGAQLTSFQWQHPKPGERRRLLGREFTPFQSDRQICRVRVSWTMHLPDSIDAANAAIRQLKQELCNL